MKINTFKNSISEKRILSYTFFFVFALVLFIFWYAGTKKQKNIVVITGAFYITAPIDTLTTLPVFNEVIDAMEPDLVLVEDIITYSLNSLYCAYADSAPEWYDHVSQKFWENLETLKKEKGFDVKIITPWRMDILMQHQKLWSAPPQTTAFVGKVKLYSLFQQTFMQTLDVDTLFIDPLLINTPIFDKLKELDGKLFAELFKEELGAAGYEMYYARVFAKIEKILSETAGKKILVICNANHKYWFQKQLSLLMGSRIAQISNLKKGKW